MGGGIFIFPTSGSSASQQSILNRLSDLENEIIKRGYYQIVSGTSGSIQTTSGITLVEGQFGSSGNSIISQINGSNYPTYNSPTDVSGNPVTSTLNTSTGAWTTSATYVQSQIAIFFVITGTQDAVDTYEASYPAYIRVVDIENELVLNGLSGSIQNFAVGTSGSDFNISSSGLTHTFNIPDAVRGYTTKVSLSSAEILALNSTPKQLLAAPGSGKIYDVQSIICKMTFGTAAYAVNTTLQVLYSGAGLVVGTNSNIINATVTKTGKMLTSAISAAGSTQYLENTALNLNVGGGNPTTGDGTLDVYITYKIITL